MNTIFFLYGIPASGKSTWAKDYVYKSRGRVKRVNKDDLRAMIDVNSAWSSENEKFVLDIRDKIVLKALRHGHDVIIDDTNFPFGGKHYLRMCELAQLVGDVQVVEKYFDITLKEALTRNNNADRRAVPEDIIHNMFKKHIQGRPYEFKTVYFPPVEKAVQDEKLPHCVIFDIDGTLALNTSGRSAYEWHRVGEDSVNEPIHNLLRARITAGYLESDFCLGKASIIIFSGRDGACETETRLWLADNAFLYSELYMRTPNDMRKDSIIKRELYEKYIKDKYYVEYVVDDRDQVVEFWRSLGLTCLQCNYGDF